MRYEGRGTFRRRGEVLGGGGGGRTLSMSSFL